MTSIKQLSANKINAQSGGVKTPEGKEKVRFNALKHGIWGNLISEYESDMYEGLLGDLIIELKPRGIVQSMIVERLAVAYLRLYRLAKAENEFIKETLNPTEISIDWKNADGYSPEINSQAMETMFMIFSRYETSIENRFYKALKEIRELKNGFVLQKDNNA